MIHPAGDKYMKQFLQALTGYKTYNPCYVYCFDMTKLRSDYLQNI